MRICIYRLTVAVNDEIAANFDFNSGGPSLETTAVASDCALEPSAVHLNRGASDEILCFFDIRDRYSRRFPPPVVTFNGDNVHDKRVFDRLTPDRARKLHPKISGHVFVFMNTWRHLRKRISEVWKKNRIGMTVPGFPAVVFDVSEIAPSDEVEQEIVTLNETTRAASVKYSAR